MKLKIELSRITEKGLQIDENVNLDKTFYKNTDVTDIKKLHVFGVIKYDYEGNLQFDIEASGIFVILDSITLDPIDYEFSCPIDTKIENIEEECQNFYEKSKNILDISEILWENIVLEIPISLTKTSSENLSLKGNGWELVNEKEEKIDPRLAKLTELLDKERDE